MPRVPDKIPAQQREEFGVIAQADAPRFNGHEEGQREADEEI